jgi:predicted  nucleic acid-binding Zn-ribbon protein
MKRTGWLILIGLIFCCTMSWGQEIYQWVDEKGTIHFTDNLGLVPEKYRNQVQKKKISIEPAPLLSPQVTTEEDLEKELKSARERRDLIGRGEDWWKARAKEWNEKLLNAQKNYEIANADCKKKEKELEESKFKPKSLQRKLKSEMKALEEKANDWKKQMEQAKNMLEKGLPKEAEELNADPNWIKIEEP